MNDKLGSQFISFWKRLAAGLIDICILVILIMLCLIVLMLRIFDVVPVAVMNTIILSLALILPWIFMIAFWKSYGATPGMLALGARVASAHDGSKPSLVQLIIRYTGYWGALLPAGVGIFWIFTNPSRQGFQDILSSTVVIPRGETLTTPLPSARTSLGRVAVLLLQTYSAAVVILLFGCACLMIFDVPLPPEVQAYLEPDKPACPVNQNAYYAMLGFAAPAEMDPHAAGVELAHRYILQQSKTIMDRLNFELNDPWGSKRLKVDDDLIKNLCDPIKSECLDTYKEQAPKILEFKQRYHILFERYHQLSRFAWYQTDKVLISDPFGPFMDHSAIVYMNRLFLAGITVDYLQGNQIQAVDALQKDMLYWRWMLVQADNLMFKMISVSMLKRDVRIYSQLMDAGGAILAGTHPGTELDPLTAPERSLARAIRGEYQHQCLFQLNLMKEVQDQDEFLIRIQSRFIPLGYKPHATQILLYRIFHDCAERSENPRLNASPQNQYRPTSLQYLISYVRNPIGTILALIGIPAYEGYSPKVRDLDTEIRLMRLKREPRGLR